MKSGWQPHDEGCLLGGWGGVGLVNPRPAFSLAGVDVPGHELTRKEDLSAIFRGEIRSGHASPGPEGPPYPAPLTAR